MAFVVQQPNRKNRWVPDAPMRVGRAVNHDYQTFVLKGRIHQPRRHRVKCDASAKAGHTVCASAVAPTSVRMGARM